MFRSKNHHEQSNKQQCQQQKLDPFFGRAKKKWDKTGHEQETVDDLVACGKDNTNTSYSGTTALIPAVLPSYSGSIVYSSTLPFCLSCTTAHHAITEMTAYKLHLM